MPWGCAGASGRVPMHIRFFIALIGLSAVFLALWTGESSISQWEAVTTIRGSFPWTDLNFPSFVTLLFCLMLGVFTLGNAMELLKGVFQTEAQYVSRGRIVYTSMLAVVAACILGAFVMPIARYGASPELWFLQYPESVWSWFLFGPFSLLALNFAREVFRALQEYEVRAQNPGPSNADLLKRISALQEALQQVVVKLPDALGGKLVEQQKNVATKLAELAAQEQKNLDGLFAQLRSLAREVGEIRASVTSATRRAAEEPAPPGQDGEGAPLLRTVG